MYTLGHERGTAALPRQVKLRTWLDRRPPAATELAGPRPADVPGPVAAGLPAAQGLDPRVERAGEIRRGRCVLG